MTPKVTQTVTLLQFLNGTVYRTGILIFEDAMNPFVKSTMKEGFLITDSNDEYAVFQRDLAYKLEIFEEKMKAVEADLKAAQEQQEKAKEDFDNNPNAESRKSFGQAKRKVGNLSKDLLALEKQRKREQKVPRPQERW
eukprot:IDg1504t1